MKKFLTNYGSQSNDSKKNILYQLYIPSIRSIGFVFFLILFFFAITHRLCTIPTSFELNQESKHYHNLIAIHAGIGIIIFALVIFIAESLRDDHAKDRARVLLRESFLFPLVVAEILVFFLFIWGQINIFSIVPILAIGFLTIWSLKRTIAVLLSNILFAQKRTELIRERVQQSINLAIDERIADNILLGKLNGKDIKMRFQFFSEERLKYHFFDTEKRGIIWDIDLRRLQEFADFVDEKGRVNGISFDATEKLNVSESRDILQTGIRQKGSFIQNQSRFLLKKLFDPVTDNSNDLICIDRDIIKDDEDISELRKIVEQIFSIKESDNFSEEVQSELAGVKDQLITAIRNKQLGEVKELRKLYVNIAEGFLKHMKNIFSSHSFDHALKERQTWGAGWEPVGWLSSDIKNVFEKAMESNDREIIRQIGYLPLTIAWRAVEYNDHYLFQEFIHFSEVLYVLSTTGQYKDKKVKDFMLSNYCLHLKELAEYGIAARIRNKEVPLNELSALKDFAIYILIVFKNLIKLSIDGNDFDSFKTFNDTTRSLFKHFKPSKERDNVISLERKYEREGLSKKLEESVKESLQYQKVLEQIEQEFSLKRQQLFFIITSWILSKLTTGKSDGNVKVFYDFMQETMPSELESLTRLFITLRNFGAEDFWKWDQWDLIPDGEVRWIDTWGKLDKLFCVKSLQTLSAKNSEQIKSIILPHSLELASLADESSDLMQVLDGIVNNVDDWKIVLNDDALNRIELFKQLLKDSKLHQQEEEAKQIRSTPISMSKIDEFKNKFIEGFYERVVLRDIFKHYKLFEEKLGTPPTELKRRGFNILDSKEAFFDEWHVHYLDWGKEYGHNLALDENLILAENIIGLCKEIEDTEFENSLREFNNISNLFLLSINTNLYRFFKYSKNFIPRWNLDCRQLNIKGFEGWYLFEEKKIPIFQIFLRNSTSKILILNSARLGELYQYQPLDEGESEDLIKDVFYMSIKSLSDNPNLINDFINKQPDWLKEKGNADKQKEYLEEHVILNIYERFKFDKHVNFEGYLIKYNE